MSTSRHDACGLPRRARGVMARDRFGVDSCGCSIPKSGARSPAATSPSASAGSRASRRWCPRAALGRRTGADVWLKLENLQRTGSFKLRGAAARLAALALRGAAARRAAGHRRLGRQPRPGRGARGAAFGLEATVLVSAQTPEIKRAGIAALGAEVEVAGATYDEAEAEARRRAAADPGLVFVSAFDDDHVIAGNGGLLAREILAQLPDVQCDRRAGRRRRPGGRHRRRGRAARDPGPRRLARSELRDAPLARRGPRLHDATTAAPTLAEGLEGAVSERTFAMARDYFPDIALVSELAIRQRHRLRLPHARHPVRGVGGAGAGRAARGRERRARPPHRRRDHRAATSSRICWTSCSARVGEPLGREPRSPSRCSRRWVLELAWPRRRRRPWRAPAPPCAARGRSAPSPSFLRALGAVAGAEHVAQVGLVLERVRVLLVVAAEAGGLGRRAWTPPAPPVPSRRRGATPGPWQFSHCTASSPLVKPEAGAADLAVAGDVAADALVVGLLVPPTSVFQADACTVFFQKSTAAAWHFAQAAHAGERRAARFRGAGGGCLCSRLIAAISTSSLRIAATIDGSRGRLRRSGINRLVK